MKSRAKATRGKSGMAGVTGPVRRNNRRTGLRVGVPTRIGAAVVGDVRSSGTLLAAILATFLGVTGASAEPPSSYTFTVTAQQVDLIGRALGGEPYRDVHALVDSLNRQISEQNAAAKPKATPDAPGASQNLPPEQKGD